jgi:hypothetical protein
MLLIDNSRRPVEDHPARRALELMTGRLLPQARAMMQYKVGMMVAVRGNDDIWLFVNSQRVIDLGGIHNPEVRSRTFHAATGTHCPTLTRAARQCHQTRLSATSAPLMPAPMLHLHCADLHCACATLRKSPLTACSMFMCAERQLQSGQPAADPGPDVHHRPVLCGAPCTLLCRLPHTLLDLPASTCVVRSISQAEACQHGFRLY